MKRNLALLLSALICASALSSCSTMNSEESQDVRFETPGVDGARCDVRRPGYIQKVFPPQTLRVTRMREPLEVTCFAPGNRQKTVKIESRIPTTFLMNLSNFYLGTPVDYHSGGMFRYPEVVSVDFIDVPAVAMPYPEYEIRDQYARDLFMMEEWRPGRGALMSDRGRTTPTLQPRIIDSNESMGFEESSDSSMMLAPGDGFAEDLLSMPVSTAGSFGSSRGSSSRSSAPVPASSTAPASSGGGDSIIPPPPPSFIK